MTVSHQLGFGVLGGLAVFQMILLANVARSMAKAGPMTSVDDVINANVVDDNDRPARHLRRPSGPPTTPRAVPDPDARIHLLSAPLLGIDITPGVHHTAKSSASPSTWTSCGPPSSPGWW